MKLISKKKIWKAIHNAGGCDAPPDSWADGWDKAIDECIRLVEEAPVVDAKPVRHGKWVRSCVCSVCGEAYGPRNQKHRQKYRYCPCCGVRMEG